jgi:hypothetical protein
VGRIAAMSESTRRLDDLAERLGRVKTLLVQLTNREGPVIPGAVSSTIDTVRE